MECPSALDKQHIRRAPRQWIETITRCTTVGRPFHDFPGREPATILARMPNGVRAAVDRQLQHLIVAWVRRQYPALQVVPARWMRPAVAPAAARLRRLLWRGVLVAATAIGIVLMLVIVKP